MPVNIFGRTRFLSRNTEEDSGVTCSRLRLQNRLTTVEIINETLHEKKPKEQPHVQRSLFRPHSGSFVFVEFPRNYSNTPPPPRPPTPPRPSLPDISDPASATPPVRKPRSKTLPTPSPTEYKRQKFNRINNEYLAKSLAEFNERFINPARSKSSFNDYKVIKPVGVGAFGTVFLVKHKRSGTYSAMKVLNKEKVVHKGQVRHTLDEKRVLQAIKCPFIVNLQHSFKDNINLYMVMDYVPGDLFVHLRMRKRFGEPLAKFYAAQIVLGLEYLHHLDIIFRDLKPENILIDFDGYLKITDFGLAKIEKTRSWTHCGTPDYMAPEIFRTRGYDRAVDWWALGILIFEMTAGYPPYVNKNNQSTMLHVLSTQMLKFPSHFSAELKDLLLKLLQVDANKRFGHLRNGVNDIRDHKWFSSIDWLKILKKTEKPLYIPKLSSPEDTSYFDQVKHDKNVFRASNVPLFENEFRDF